MVDILKLYTNDDTIPICANCKHYYKSAAYRYSHCTRTAVTNINIVTGERFTNKTELQCEYERRRTDEAGCGANAQFFIHKNCWHRIING